MMERASWIWMHGEAHPDEYVRFYQSFWGNSGETVIELSCDSGYELYVNGSLAGFGQYSDLPEQKTYSRIDITRFCCLGENRIVLLVWYYGRSFMTYQKGRAGLIFEVTEDGSVVACSGHTTLCSQAPDYLCGVQRIITGQLGFSYTYDMRSYDGYREATFMPTEGDWRPAVVQTDRETALSLRPVRSLQLKPFAQAVLVDEAHRIYDLGMETVGYLSLMLNAPLGTHVTVSFGEHLVCDGAGVPSVPRRIADRDFSVELIACGKLFRFSNHLRRLGCRYLQVLCDANVEVEQIGLYPVEYPVHVRPFETSSPLRKRIYDVCVHTLRCCMFEHYEDCPWREQALYTLDSRNQMLCGYYAFEEYEFARASLRLFGETQWADGSLPICAPSDVELSIPFFSLFYIVEMREYAEHSGDVSLIHAYADGMRRLLRAFTDREEDGLIPNFYDDRRYWNFYEWNPELQGHGGRDEGRSFDLVLNAMLSLCLQDMGEMMRMVGNERESDAWNRQAERCNAAINRAFYRASDGSYRAFLGSEVCAELGSALAVLCGAAKGRVAERVCEQLAAGDRKIPVTFSMRGLKYDALLKVDRERYAGYILREIDATYASMLDRGATSFWETLRGSEDFAGAGSLCHGWSAIPIVYYRRLCVEPASFRNGAVDFGSI